MTPLPLARLRAALLRLLLAAALALAFLPGAGPDASAGQPLVSGKVEGLLLAPHGKPVPAPSRDGPAGGDPPWALLPGAPALAPPPSRLRPAGAPRPAAFRILPAHAPAAARAPPPPVSVPL